MLLEHAVKVARNNSKATGTGKVVAACEDDTYSSKAMYSIFIKIILLLKSLNSEVLVWHEISIGVLETSVHS